MLRFKTRVLINITTLVYISKFSTRSWPGHGGFSPGHLTWCALV